MPFAPSANIALARAIAVVTSLTIESEFSESGEATWPDQKFNYELSLNDPGASCDYLQSESAAKQADDNRKRFGYAWKAGKLSIFAARLAGKKVVCDARPIAVLTPQ